MLRVLASHPADATGAITEDEVVGFLDASLAAFQAREGGQAQWDRDRLRASFHQLAAVGLITAEGDGFRLTELGRFTGESGVHVDSIIRLVRGIGGAAGQLNSVALIAAAQLTNELNEIYLPVNARAKWSRPEVFRGLIMRLAEWYRACSWRWVFSSGPVAAGWVRAGQSGRSPLRGRRR